jgi:hypothetical protein
MAAGVLAPAAPAATPVHVSYATEQAADAAARIDLDVTRNGRLLTALTWSGGSGPYEVWIDPSEGSTVVDFVDETSLNVPTESGLDYCFQVFGADGSESGRECGPPLPP